MLQSRREITGRRVSPVTTIRSLVILRFSMSVQRRISISRTKFVSRVKRASRSLLTCINERGQAQPEMDNQSLISTLLIRRILIVFVSVS